MELRRIDFMPILYHYTKVECLEPIIKSGGLIMKNPNTFNDPYDCIFFQDENDKTKTHKLLKNYAAFLGLSDFVLSDRVYTKMTDKSLINIVRKEIIIEQTLIKKTLRYDYQPGLNKLTDMVVKRSPELKIALEKSIKEWDERIEAVFEKTKNNARIACFSKRNDSMLMWSHYSNSHQGVCIEYDVEDIDCLRNVEYIYEMKGSYLYKVMSNILAVDYLTRNKIEFNNKEMLDEGIIKPFYAKSIDWSYEEEVRCIYFTTNNNRMVVRYNDGYLFNVGLPKSIIIGYKVSDEKRKEIIDIAKKYNIPCHQTKLNDKEFKIDIIS